MKRSILALAALLALSCADKTAIVVVVTSDELAVPDDVDGLRFQVVSENDRTLDETYALDRTWPHSLSILPASGELSRVTITVTGLRDGSPRVRRVVRTAFDRGATRRITLELESACVGVPCGADFDCVGGVCVGQDLEDGGVGVDAGLDGGADAGRDAGGEDGGPSDAGRDAGRDAGTDAGRDAGRDAGTDAGTPGPLSLLFSEYVEGSSSNKALEIANLGASPVDLSRCSVRRFANGTSSPTPIALSGTLAAGDVFVVCHGSLEGAATLCDATTATLSHNGNDAYDLFCDGATLDTFGQIGVDPGAAWTGGGLSTLDYVLRRRCTVTAGDANGSDAFDPSVEWTGSAWADAATSLTGLGNRAECP